MRFLKFGWLSSVAGLAAPRSKRTLLRRTMATRGGNEASREVAGLSSIVDQYDVFLLDQYGVLHNGEKLLDGVADALEKLHAAGKKIVVLSNTSRRLSVLLEELPKRGFPAEFLTGAVCSGEECYKALAGEWRGKKCLMLGWLRDANDLAYLDGTDVTLATAAEADCIVAHGPDTLYELGSGEATKTNFRTTGDVTPYLAALKVAADRGLPMLCANPDQITLQGTDTFYMPGMLADAYRSLGGTVIEYGKPQPAHFKAAVALCGDDKPRVIHVGDSLKHDVLGAVNAGFDSLFIVETGVHAEEFKEADWRKNPLPTIAHLADEYKTPLPSHYIDKFRW